MAYTSAQLIAAWTAANNGVTPDAGTTALLNAFAAQTQTGAMSDATALAYVINSAQDDVQVAVQAYQFFTGAIPSAAGLDYLTNSVDNTSDLNDAYYAQFNLENRYINFAANLGSGAGEGAAGFAAAYGALTFAQAVDILYETIIGSSYATAAGISAVAAKADITARYANFVQLATDRGMITSTSTAAEIDLAVKASLVGYLMAEGVKADVGIYAAGANNFVNAAISGTEVYSTSLITTYSVQGGGTGSPVAPAPVNVDKSFTLSTSADTGANFTGAAGNDTYTGLINADNGTGTSLGAGDNLNGGAGTDTLNVNISGESTAAVTVSATTLTGVERVLVTNFDTNADDTEDHDFNAALWTGVTTLGLAASNATGDTKFSNVATIAIAEMKSGAADLEIDYAAGAVSGTADVQTLVLDAVSAGTFTIDAGIETVSVAAAATASASTLTDLVATGATKLNIDSDANLTITNALDTNVVTIDGSASLGRLSLNFTAGAADLAVTGGSGNDTFTFNATGTLTSADTISGGEGTDTIRNVSAEFEALDASTMTKVTSIEALSITDAATAGETLTTASFGSIGRVTLEAATAGAYTVAFATGGGTTVFAGGNLGGTLTVSAAGTATTDAATVAYGTGGDANGQAIVTSGIETLTISNSVAADTTGAITMGSVSTGGSSKLVFTGNKTMTVAAITATTVDASGLTGTAALVQNAAAATSTSITGSANADTLLGRAAAATTIDGGAGNDNITGGTSADNLAGGVGNDTLTGAGGNDVITGGDGNDSIDVSGAAGTTNVNGGAGNDTITFNSRLSASDSIEGGDGTDTIAITAADVTALNAMTFGEGSTLNANINGVERVSVGALGDSTTASNILDMSRLDNIANITVTAQSAAAASQISGMVDGSTVTITGDLGDTDTLTLGYASTTGTQTLNLVVSNSASVDVGVVTAAGIENVNVNSTTTNATPSSVTNTLDLTISSATTVTVTGDAIADIDNLAVNAATINASANTAGVRVLGGSANQTLTGTAAVDLLNGGAGADTIDAGAGADTIIGGSGADALTAGEGADTVTGGSGNDTIVLTETTAAVDVVNVTYSEAGASIDFVTGFATTSAGDKLVFDISDLGAVTASGGIAANATTFAVLGAAAATPVGAGASVVQVLTGAATASTTANVFVLSGATFSTSDEVEDALEAGGAFALTIDADNDVQHNSFVVVYSTGTETKVAAVHIAAVGAADTDFEAGNLNVIDLMTLNGVTTIGSSTFASANFEFVA